jgi:hypothetical protein
MKKVGRIESISFPELNISSISAKVDTGAFGTCIHVDNAQVIDGKLHVSIGSSLFVYDKYKTVTVKSSFGRKQTRYSVFTKMVVGNFTYKVFISLTNREKMKFPVLIGRRFLYKFNYIVDVRKKNINSGNKKM